MRRQETLRDLISLSKKLIRGYGCPLPEAGSRPRKWTGPDFGSREPLSRTGTVSVLIPGTWTAMSLHLSRFGFISVAIHNHRKYLCG